jgi:hypothetical protein
MDETLKSIRLSHNLLLAICIAVIGFAISPSEVERYRVLLNELQGVRRVLGEHDPALLEKHKEDIIEQHTDFGKKMNHALSDLGLSLSKNVHASSLIPLHYPTDILVDQRGEARTLSQILDRLRKPEGVSIFKPDDLEGDVRAWLGSLRGTGANLNSIRLGGIELAGRPQLEAYFDTQLSRESYLANRDRILKEMASLPFFPRVVDTVNPVVITFDVRIHGDNESPIKNEGFEGWLFAQSGSSAQHASSEDIVERFIPAEILAAIGDLGDLTIDKAMSEVARKGAEAKQHEKVSLFGVDIPADTATLMAPLASALMLLYLVAQLLNARPRNSEHYETMREFPWVGLFPDALSRILTALSIAVLPPVVNLWLLIRLWPAKNWLYWAGTTLMLPILVTGITAVLNADKLRKVKTPNTSAIPEADWPSRDGLR